MIIAVDTGGTKTLITCFDRAGKPGKLIKFPTPKDENEYTHQLIGQLTDVSDGKKIDAVVIGIPGIIKNNIVTWAGGNLPWQDLDLGKIVANTLDCPVFVENDANLAGLAEAHALKNTPDGCLYITISTGIGSGIILDGEIAPGTAQSEAGHIYIEYDGRVREWESFASGRAIVSTYGKMAKDIHEPKIWEQIADKISRGLLVMIPILQPDIVIIGGSVGSYFDQYGSYLEKLLDSHLPDHIVTPSLKQAQHPEEAVIYGCYYHGKNKLSR